MKGSIEINCGLVFPLSSLSYESMQMNGDTNGVEWMSVGNDGMVKMISLYSI